MMAEAESGLLTIEEAAAFLGISRRTFLRMDSSGKLPLAVRLGRCKRWNKRELLCWIDYGNPLRQKWSVIWVGLRGTNMN